MKWLKELVDVDLTVEELVDRLDMTGTAVESVRAVGEGLDGVVVGSVLTKEPHPDADKLSYCSVDVGGDEPLRIVCGATNFEAGDCVPVACVGATLPGDFTIKKTKLRGLVSEGMMCSSPELGLGGDASGLLVLPPDAPVGMAFAEYLGQADTVVELEVTPNRPDCLSMVGVAREVAAITGKHATAPVSVPEESGVPVHDAVSVEIADPDLCSRYTARLIRGVSIGPSPEWLAERVTAAGARPVNNIVDITNLVMFELGQPLHAFDAATLALRDGKAAVTVRRAGAGERLTTLDGQERVLDPNMLVIADDSGAIALAGVMGGENTEVSDTTVDILLESACFEPTSTSLTSRSLGLISEASTRFERGVDAEGCVRAADRAAALMAEVAGGTIAPGVVDVYPVPAIPGVLEMRIDRMNAVLGTGIPAGEAAGILTALGLGVEPVGEGLLRVSVPTFRPDLEREIDLIEEVVRVWGMERVPVTLPGGRGRVGRLTSRQRWMRRIDGAMRAAGLNETMTYSFVDPGDHERIRMPLGEGETLVELVNPMSEEQAVMRISLLPGLLRSVSYNQRRGVPDVHLYEIGSVFSTSEGRKLPREHTAVGGVMAGMWSRPGWTGDDHPLDFFDGKGVIEALVDELSPRHFQVRPADLPWLQPGRSAEVLLEGKVAGWLGEVHPSVADAFEAEAPIVAFELDAGVLIATARPVRTYTEVPRYPAVTLDVALLVDEKVSAERVEHAMRKAGGPLLDSVRLFDVYRGKGVAEGRKSLAWALSYRAPDRTLSDDEVRPVHEKLLRKVCGAVGAELRS
ncbi:MAG: phenylalanine--tRNA ligase subunit beta [Anaerosomatales bacterium]|nr:phenylalanine--tRNA ligase subunit beta [Anaerosomatales bacterium]MDT8434859.1 phenylalanine--tRNA ligase subunit beta [Anaerosomatales bacterium]